MKLDVTINEYPTRYLAGMSVRVRAENAAFMSPELWRKLGPRWSSLYCYSGDKTFGLLVSSPEKKTFHYWTAVEFSKDEPLPGWVRRIMLIGGWYATAYLAHPEMLGEAFHFLYHDWIRQRPDFVADMEKPCVETYCPYWKPDDPIGVHIPLIKK